MMKSLILCFLNLLIIFNNNIFASENDKSFQEQSMLSVLYVQTSAEFEANNIQTYNSAKDILDFALSDNSWTALLEQKSNYADKPPAIIIDVDETVLDNSKFQGRTIISGLSYPNGWIEWVNEANATPVAGVKDFLEYTDKKGIKIFYLTNRLESLRDATQKNLIKLNLPFDTKEKILLMREDPDVRDKTSRRELIAEKYRVLLLIGDQLTDFVSTDEAYVFHKERKKVAKKYDQMWGKKWFMITNPTYGRWEYSLYDQFPESEEEAIKYRKEVLKR